MRGWSARAASGDVGASLLQPHQVLISHQDAHLHSITALSLLRVAFSANSWTLLQCVVDRPSCTASLSPGRIQLHAWVLEASGHPDGASATLEVVEQQRDAGHCANWRLSLSLRRKSPTVASSAGGGSLEAELKGSRIDLLPESVRQKQVDLEVAIQRQTSAAGMFLAPAEGQLVPVRILGDIFVFRIDAMESREEGMEIIVTGWSDKSTEGATEKLMEQMAALSTKESATLLEDQLDERLWRVGFAGYIAFMQDVLLNVALVLRPSQVKLAGTVKQEQIGSHGILISGVNGVGKSLALVALQNELAREKINTWRVDGMSLLMGAESSTFPTAFEYLQQELERRFPSFELGNFKTGSSSCCGVVLIDDLDVLFQSPSGQVADDSDGQLPQLGSALLRVIEELSSRNMRLVIVGTTTNADVNVPLAVTRTGRFGKIVDLTVPTEQARCEILCCHLRSLPLPADEGLPVASIAASLSARLSTLTGGYVAKDLVRICRNAAAQAHTAPNANGKHVVGWNELLLAQQRVKPSQLRELNVASPGAPVDGKLTFAGYAVVRKQLFDFVSWKFHPTDAMSRLGISNASGILLSGPSGCGKTLLVQTLAAQVQVNFVSVKSSELLSKYFGDSEKSVRELFARARAASPCLLFFDEFDSIAHKRSFGEGDGGSSGGGVYARVLSTFLNEMDGVGSQRVAAASASRTRKSSSSNGGDILVVAATNRKDALDAALIRPGRIDKAVELGYPTQEDIQEILTLYTSKMPLAADVDIGALAARPRGFRSFTGADIAAICKEAAFRALREDINANNILLRHLEAAWDQRAQDIHRSK